MARVEVLGPRQALPQVLAFLQARGVLELRTAASAGAKPLHGAPAPSGGEDDRRLDEAVRRIDALTARLPAARGGDAEPLPPPGTEAFAERLGALEAELGRLEASRAALARERDFVTRFGRLVVSLAPIGHGLDPALEPEVHGLVLRTDGGVALALLEAEVRTLTGGACEVKAQALDGETTGVLLAIPRAHAAELGALLRERGVDAVALPAAYTGKRLVSLLLLLASRERALPAEIARADTALAAFAATSGRSLAAARAAAAAALERRRAAAACGETHFAYVVTGYMPAEGVATLRAAAAAELGDRVTLFARTPAPAEWGDVPVVLRNRSVARPFQRLLAFVPLPRYGSVDPTPWLAVFFPLLFGLVLGDVGFGVVGTLVALVAWKAGWGGAAGRDLAKVALWCSLSAAAFGLLFGEAFGELGQHVGMRPLLLDRRGALMSFLALALAAGGVHVAVGMILGVATAVRRRDLRNAVGRAAKLLLLASSAAAIAAVGGVLPRDALVPVLAVSAALLGVALAAEGPLALLDLVLGLGNVLSYARLMALGLASVMLAEVANRVAGTLEPAAAGLALAVLLHAVNFTLGLVSPAIAALRLQYVEFFEKFYDEGGEPYRPFGLTG